MTYKIQKHGRSKQTASATHWYDKSYVATVEAWLCIRQHATLSLLYAKDETLMNLTSTKTYTQGQYKVICIMEISSHVGMNRCVQGAVAAPASDS